MTPTVANGHAILRLVELRIQYKRASNHVAEHGPVRKPKSKKAKVGQWNPYWSVMKRASDAIGSLDAEFGTAPTPRGNATKGSKSTRTADPYLRPVP